MATTPLEALMLTIQEQIVLLDYRQYPGLSLFVKADEYQELIKWNINVGGAATGGRATNAANAIAGSTDDLVAASLPIGLRTMGTRFDLVSTKIVQARQAGPGALKNLFKCTMDGHFEKMLNDLNSLLYTGDGTTTAHGVFGLDYVTSPTQPTYAGVSGVTYPKWTGTTQANAGTARPLTRALLGNMHKEIVKAGGSYDLIVMSHDLIEKYDQLFADQASTTVNVTPMGYADLGFTGYSYKGRPMIGDNGCPAGKIYFINTRQVRLFTFNLAGSSPNSAQAESSKTMGLNLLIGQVRNENPDVFSWELSVKPQLQVMDRKRSVAVLADIAA